MHRGYTSVLISSKSFISDYARGFDIDPSIIYEAPLPRTDLLINSSYRAQQRERIIREFPELGASSTSSTAPRSAKRRPPIRLRRQQPSPMPSITTSTT